MLKDALAASEVVQLMMVGRASGDGTARAMIVTGSLRGLLVLSFGAIMPSAEMIVRVTRRAAILHSTFRTSPPEQLMTVARHSHSNNRVRTLSTDFGADA